MGGQPCCGSGDCTQIIFFWNSAGIITLFYTRGKDAVLVYLDGMEMEYVQQGVSNTQELLAEQIFHTDRATIEKVRSDIERSDGLVMLFVHPYFAEKREWNDHESELKAGAVRNVRRTDAFISNESQRKPPIIIFEQSSDMQATIERIRASGPSGTVLIAPTIQGWPTPSEPVSDYHFPYEVEANWEPMKRVLRYLGVRKILLGGMYLTASGQTSGEYKHLQECVGVTHDKLKEEFTVEISSFSFPLARKDIHPKRAA